MIITHKQMLSAEKYAEACGTSLSLLMDNAGKALAEEVKRIAYKNMLTTAVILCGKGNNGGDGFVCANHLCDAGLTVTVALVCGEPSSELAKAAFNKLKDEVKVIRSDFVCEIENCGIVIDAVFGTGFRGEFHSDIAELFSVAAQSNTIKIACDVPSGVDCQNGEVSLGTIEFNTTVTFHAAKAGCLLKPAKSFCGEIIVKDIGIPERQNNYCDFIIEDAGEDFPAEVLPKRPETGHKGTFGRLITVCGSISFRGAALLSASAALRSGSGLVEVCSAKDVISGMWSSLPEAIYSEIDMSYPDLTAEILLQKSANASAILVGCGLTSSAEVTAFMEKLIQSSEIPLIIDADGINSISRNIDVLLNAKAKIILTPHPAELARICGISVSDVLKNRLEIAVKTARKYNCIISAKGADTFVTDGNRVVLSRFGNTALSKGGSGDILAGITASLIAQGTDPLNACAAASVILGKTAQMLSETASQRGIIGSDIIAALPYAFKKLNI